MKFYMYGMYKRNEAHPEDPYDTFIGISAETKKEAEKQLVELVGEEKAKQFELYDVLND